MPPLKNNTFVSLPPTFAPRLSHRGWVKVYHPHATTGVYPMLRFAVFPNPATPEDDTDSGIPVGVVLDACSILAQNQRGRLVLADHTFIADDSSNPDLLLGPDTYIFYVVDEDGSTVVDDYFICAGFGDWIPPPIIPDRWLGGAIIQAPSASHPQPMLIATSDVSAAAQMDDNGCIMSGRISGTRGAHMVPNGESELRWWKTHQEQIELYGGAPDDLDSIKNTATVRADLNWQGIDNAGLFLWVPHGPDGNIVTLVVAHTAEDLAAEFHFRRVRFPARILRAYLFIRFAYNIFVKCAFGLEDAVTALTKRRTRWSKRKRRDDGNDNGDGDDSDDRDNGRSEVVPSRKKRKSRDSGAEGGLDAQKQKLLRTYEMQDKVLAARGTITREDERLGRYPGFYEYRRLAMEYQESHPTVSGMTDPQACIWGGDAELEDARGWLSV